jgi:WhiB family transcriptional regulator, redox-sensing transcriptional regulator
MEQEISNIIAGAPEMDWLDDAACADREIGDFFVEAGRIISHEALEVCRACPVRVDCLRHAYDRNLTAGYFGGTSPGQRRNMTLGEAEEFISEDLPRTNRPAA